MKTTKIEAVFKPGIKAQILYTEQEVKNLVNQVFIEGSKSGQKPLRDFDIDNWFEKIKKK